MALGRRRDGRRRRPHDHPGAPRFGRQRLADDPYSLSMRRLVTVVVLVALAFARPARAERVPAGRLDAGAVVVRFDEPDRAVAAEGAALAPGALGDISMSTGDRDESVEIRLSHQARGMAELAPDNAPP